MNDYRKYIWITTSEVEDFIKENWYATSPLIGYYIFNYLFTQLVYNPHLCSWLWLSKRSRNRDAIRGKWQTWRFLEKTYVSHLNNTKQVRGLQRLLAIEISIDDILDPNKDKILERWTQSKRNDGEKIKQTMVRASQAMNNLLKPSIWPN